MRQKEEDMKLGLSLHGCACASGIATALMVATLVGPALAGGGESNPLAGVTVAAVAANSGAEQDVAVFEQRAAQCASSSRDAALNRCIGDALQGLSAGLQRGNVSGIAPQAAPAMAKAGADVTAAGTRPAARSALSRAQAVVRGLAARSSGEAARVYGHLMRALSRAQTALGVGS
jgi:hypothetical protein